MATIDAYAGRFVGNDFVVRQLPKQKTITRTKIQYSEPQEVAPIQYASEEPIAQTIQPISLPPVYEPVAIANDYVAPLPERSWRIPMSFSILTNHRRKIMVYGVLSLAVISLLAVSVLAKTTIERTARSSVTFAEKTLSDVHANSPAAFSLPTHSILIHNSDLTNDLDDIEAQPININLGATTISPSPDTISQWVKTTNGPQNSAKVLTVNTASIASYLKSSIESDPQFSSAEMKDSAMSSVPQLSQQIAKILFTCKGITLTVPTSLGS